MISASRGKCYLVATAVGTTRYQKLPPRSHVNIAHSTMVLRAAACTRLMTSRCPYLRSQKFGVYEADLRGYPTAAEHHPLAGMVETYALKDVKRAAIKR